MVEYTRRVHTLLTQEQFAILRQLSREKGQTVSALIRDAVEKVYFEPTDRERRRATLSRLLRLSAPVADWQQMEDEIIEGALE